MQILNIPIQKIDRDGYISLIQINDWFLFFIFVAIAAY